MRNIGLVLLLVGAVVWTAGCAGYNTQAGAVVGAGAGALAGQAIGGDTESTLLGAALGGVTGAVVGNAIDTYNERSYSSQYGVPSASPTLGQASYQSGNGRWVYVPGQWVDGQWVPPHQVWVPAGAPAR